MKISKIDTIIIGLPFENPGPESSFAIAEKNIEIFQDKENHNSIIESSRLAGTKLTRYQHLDYESLENSVIASNADKKIIIADSVFSMTGEESNLEKLSMIASKQKCLLFIDDAHGFGVTRNDHRRFQV